MTRRKVSGATNGRVKYAQTIILERAPILIPARGTPMVCPNSSTTLERVQTLLQNHFSLAPEQVQPDTPLADLVSTRWPRSNSCSNSRISSMYRFPTSVPNPSQIDCVMTSDSPARRYWVRHPIVTVTRRESELHRVLNSYCPARETPDTIRLFSVRTKRRGIDAYCTSQGKRAV
jgi:hypothetical protein